MVMELFLFISQENYSETTIPVSSVSSSQPAVLPTSVEQSPKVSWGEINRNEQIDCKFQAQECFGSHCVRNVWRVFFKKFIKY